MATSTKIETTAEVGNLYVVAFGLQKGDKIVAKGANKLRGNSKINPQEMPFDSIAKPIEKVFR